MLQSYFSKITFFFLNNCDGTIGDQKHMGELGKKHFIIMNYM